MMNPFSKLRDNPGWCWLVWSVYVALWTTSLVLPLPDHGGWALEPTKRLMLAKTVHVCAYAVMTVLTGCLPVGTRFRLLLLFFLMAHGSVTELIQLRISNRSGMVEDVVLDHLGILAGLLLSWKWWSKSQP